MKKSIKLIAVAFATLTSLNLNAQDSPSVNVQIAKANLAGTWNATCGTEFENQATVKFCDVCTFKMNPSSAGTTTISSPTLTFKGDSVTIVNDANNQTVGYKIYNEKHGIAFNYNNKAFLFRVFYVDKDIILTDQDGYVMRLTKKAAAKPKSKAKKK